MVGPLLSLAGPVYCPVCDGSDIIEQMNRFCGGLGGKFSTFQKAKVPYKRTFTDRKCVLAFFGGLQDILRGQYFYYEI